MVKRKLSDVLDEINNAKPSNFWRTKLLEMQVLLNEKRYSALGQRIRDLLESDMVTGRVKPPKAKAQKTYE